MYRAVLAKAVHSLSRIGDELYVEPQDDGVSCCDAVCHTLPPVTHAASAFPVSADIYRSTGLISLRVSVL